ncbi:MAG: hypothetical protein DRQ88_10535 [Epsilonproteobacteria bacterium]|nr:MAG: hypothetical protein DRQ88_10535 [Campylobacterota bacterium]RLA65629.1 MAG: hypothetical protein DRQ89_01140 [Campylobacterota bacterium]
MKKHILITTLLLSLLSTVSVAKEGHLSSYWHALPENGLSIDKANTSDSLNSVDDFFTNMVGSSLGALDDYENDPLNKATKNGWHLGGFKTSIALGFSGKIGLLAFGGTKALEVYWAKKKKKAVKEENLESSIPTVTITDQSSQEDLANELEPVIKQLVASKKIKDEKEFRKNLKSASEDFYAYTQGMKSVKSKYIWRPAKVRLDMNFSATGSLVPAVGVLVKVGGAIRVRLEFVRIMSKNPAGNKMANHASLSKRGKKIREGTKTLLHDLSFEVTKAYEDLENKWNPEDHDFTFKLVGMAVGFGASGNVGVASFSGSVIPIFYFKRFKDGTSPSALDKSAKRPINLIVDNDSTNFGYAKSAKLNYDKGIKESLFKLARKKVRKGLKKAMKFAYKTTNKIHKKAERRKAKGKESKWIVSKIKSAYVFSLGGSVGPAKIFAKPLLLLFWVNKNK